MHFAEQPKPFAAMNAQRFVESAIRMRTLDGRRLQRRRA